MASDKSWTLEIASPVASPRLFRAAVMDWHTLVPKLASRVRVQRPRAVEGEGGVENVRQFNFTSVMPFGFTKERLEFLGVDKCEWKSTVVEGGGIGVRMEMAASHMKVEPAADGGSVVKVDSTYKLPPGVEVKPPLNFMEKFQFLDVENCECKTTVIEGGGIETAASYIKVEAAADGGSVVKVELSYKPLPDVEVKEDEIAKAKESVTAIFKTAEEFLLANPDAYN